MTHSLQNPPILTVSQLTTAIKSCLESTFPTIWLQGEISNCKLHTSGHLYLSLKDSSAQIAGVMYRLEASKLGYIPKDGTQVIVCGELNVYPPKGNYQLLIKELRPVGIGELLQKLEELKQKLLKKGYFKKERKRPLPKFPRRIGVITSPTGAAIQDILNILTRRFYGFHLILNPVKVQGEGAAREIARAIEQFNAYDLADVLIVGRGGGSLEDLWAFNEEVVADALFISRIPTIAAVGHETDHCIADYAADVRAPTPSAAAEIVIAEKAQQLEQLGQVQKRLQQTLHHLIRQDRRRLEGIKRHPLFTSPYGLLGAWMQKVDHYREDIDRAFFQRLSAQKAKLEAHHKILLSLKPTNQIKDFRQKLLYFDKAIQQAWKSKMTHLAKPLRLAELKLQQQWKKYLLMKKNLLQSSQKYRQLDQLIARSLSLNKERLDKMSQSLHSINPKNLLSKGYAILFAEKDRSVISSIRTVEHNQPLRLLLSDGEILSIVKEIFARE